MTSDLTSALEVSHIMRYINQRILYFTLLRQYWKKIESNQNRNFNIELISII